MLHTAQYRGSKMSFYASFFEAHRLLFKLLCRDYLHKRIT